MSSNGSQDVMRVVGAIIAVVVGVIGFASRTSSRSTGYDPTYDSNNRYLSDLVNRALALEAGKAPAQPSDPVELVGPLQLVTHRSAGTVTANNVSEGMVDSATLAFACQHASALFPVRGHETLERLAPGQQRTLNLNELRTCRGAITWTLSGLRHVGRSDAPARLVEVLVDRSSSQLEGGAWVSFLEKRYGDDLRVPLVLAAAHGLPLDVSGPEERAMALGALEELRDASSRLSLLTNADVALVPLLEASNGSFSREERALVDGVATAFAGRRGASLSADDVLLRARGHDVVSRPVPMLSRAEAMRQLVLAVSKKPSPEVAAALVAHWAMTDDDPNKTLTVLAEMPQLAAGAMLERLDHPTGAERRWFAGSSAFVTTPSIARVLDAELGATLQTRLDASNQAFKTRQKEHLDALVARWDSARAGGDAKQALTVGREAVRLAPSSFRARLVDELNQHASTQPPFVAEALLDEALRLDPSSDKTREARGRLEAAMLDTLTRDDVLFDGPSPAWPQRVVANPSLLDEPGSRAADFVLLTSAGQSGYRPASGVAELLHRRLDAMKAANVPVPWAGVIHLRAYWYQVRWGLAALLGVFVCFVLVASWRTPERVALWLARRGWWRALSLGLMRRRARALPNEHQVFVCVQVLTELASHERSLAPTLLEEAITLRVETVDNEPDTSALIARLRLMVGDVATARESLNVYVKHCAKAPHPAWLLRSVHHDLARLCWRERDDAAAARHARLAGDPVLAAAAGLRAGTPTSEGLWTHAIRRHRARLVLVHTLIDSRRLTLASLVARALRRADPHATYARARLAHARGQRTEAKAAYRAVRDAVGGRHTGAQLGLAMLEDDRATQQRELEALTTTGSSEVALSARLQLAFHSPTPTEALATLAGLGRCAHWLESHTVATQHCRLNQFELATVAMKRAKELGGGPELDVGLLAIAARALEVGDASAAVATLREATPTDSTRMVVHLAQWTTALRSFRAVPQEGFRPETLGDGEWLGVPTPFLRVATLLAQGRLQDARVAAVAHQREPLCAWLVAATSGEPTPTTAANDAAALTLRAEQIRSLYPSIRGAFELVHAVALFARGHLTLARAALEKVPFSSDLSDPVTFARAGLAAAMGANAEHGLGALLALARDEEHSKAIAALDAMAGTPCVAVRELRLALGARVALGALREQRLSDVVPALQAALQWRPLPADAFSETFGKVRAALALADTSQWRNNAFEHPGFLMEGARGQTHAVLALVQLGKEPTAEHLETALRSLVELSENRATLAQYRLRALELAGPMPLASRTEFEDAVQDRLTTLVVAVLEAMLAEHVSILPGVMSQWPGEEGLVQRARRTLTNQLGEVMRHTLESAALRSKECKTPVQASELYLEVDLAVTRHLHELKMLGAPAETVASAEDVAARGFDQLSIDFYNLHGPSSAAVSSVNRALELEREANTRERLQRNRGLMDR